MIARNEQPDLAQTFQHRPLRARLSLRPDDPPSVNVATPSLTETKPGWRVRNVLAPTDFSPASVEAVAQAAALARRYDALLTILHVIDVNPPSARMHVGPAEELMRRLWATGRAELRRLEETLAQQQTRTQARIIEGLPAEEFIRRNADPTWLFQNEMYEELHEWQQRQDRLDRGKPEERTADTAPDRTLPF